MLKIKKISLLFLLVIVTIFSYAQSKKVDSLLNVLELQEGKARMQTLRNLSKEYMNNSVEDAIKYASELLVLAE